MNWKQMFDFRNPLRESTTIILILALIIIPFHPVNPRPRSPADNPSHSVSHEITDIDPQLPEDEQFLTEVEVLEDDLHLDEEYPEHDESVEDNRGLRKARHNKNGKKTVSTHHGVLMKATSETNDSVPETPQDYNADDFNATYNGDNNTAVDENVIQLSQIKRESQDKEFAERSRERRLDFIKQVIESYRNGTVGDDPKPTTLPIDVINMIRGKVNISQFPPLDDYPMKRRSFHPSCSLPNNTDVELWADSNSMNLLFNLSYPAPQNTTVTIIAATLRLYKFAQGNHSISEPSCIPRILATPLSDVAVDDSSEPQRDSPVIPELALPLISPTANVLQDDDKQIRVSVYWYTRSLKKNKVKRKLLDSRMMSMYGKDEWVEFNVRHAARQWRQLGKNFGLVVEVENEDGEVLKASDYFNVMNCSNEPQQNRSQESSCPQSAPSSSPTTAAEQAPTSPPSSARPPDSPTPPPMPETSAILSQLESLALPLMSIHTCSPL